MLALQIVNIYYPGILSRINDIQKKEALMKNAVKNKADMHKVLSNTRMITYLKRVEN